MNKALVTGVTGQNGAYLAESLLAKGGEVHGIRRRTSSFNTACVDHLYQDPHLQNNNLYLRHRDQSATSNRIMGEIEPDEVHDLDAMSRVAVPSESPNYTVGVDGIGVLRLPEAMRFLVPKRRRVSTGRRRQNRTVRGIKRLGAKRRRSIRAARNGYEVAISLE